MVHVKPVRRAAIVAVGSELLTPSRVDTNSLLITEQLNLLGIEVVFKGVVGDDREELGVVLANALERADLVVCSGGLGPTDDDVTRDAVAALLTRPLEEDGSIAERIRARFAARGLEMPGINRRQAMVPQGAAVLENERGTAPGLWLEAGDRVLLLLPGPPREMTVVLAAARGRLEARADGWSLARAVVRITGRTESHAEEVLRPLYAEWMQAVPPIAATILASLGQVELHVSARSRSREDAESAVRAAAARVAAAIGPDAFSVDGRAMEQVVGDLLAARGLSIAVAESCTGGLITSRLTDVPGSSRYVDRSVVVYANTAKTALLGVSPALLAEHGAVSDAVARAMAEGMRERAGTDVGVGVTGVAGPGGGTPEKPVGTVVIAVATPDGTRSRMFHFPGDRAQIKYHASQAALDMVRRLLEP